MKISELLSKLKGVDPEKEVTPDDLTDAVNDKTETSKEAEDTSKEAAPESKDSKAPDNKPEASDKSPTAATDNTSAVDVLLQKQAELEAKLEEMVAQNEALQKQKAEADAKGKLDKALAEGWLLPYMLEEAEGKPSVFVDLAKNEPEVFDRLKLVMTPKIMPKTVKTKAPVDVADTGDLSDEEKYNKINNLAKERGISYAEAAKLIK